MLQPNIVPNISANQSVNQTAGITEVVLPKDNGFAFLLPMLAYLSQESNDRWLTWFPPAGINKALLESFGFDLSKVRIVNPKDKSQLFFFLWEALCQGNSSTVVASPGLLSESEFAQLENAARIGKCRGLLIRAR